MSTKQGHTFERIVPDLVNGPRRPYEKVSITAQSVVKLRYIKKETIGVSRSARLVINLGSLHDGEQRRQAVLACLDHLRVGPVAVAIRRLLGPGDMLFEGHVAFGDARHAVALRARADPASVDAHGRYIALLHDPILQLAELEGLCLLEHLGIEYVVEAFVPLPEQGADAGSHVPQGVLESFAVGINEKSPIGQVLLGMAKEEGFEVA